MKTVYSKYIKRVLDFIISLLALTVLSPLLLVLTLVGAVKMRGNPFFVQERPGRNGRVFRLIKLRSMTNEKKNGELLPDEERLTGYGRFLRRTSLDELPELLNILVGHMSIVGPRPLLVKYLPLYNEHQARRHEVRPGLTGWAQVNGRNSITWEQKFDYDVWYVDHVSFALDVRIVMMTVRSVLKREGISGENNATMAEFEGSREKTNV
ncbi:MAG: sugar transferase [Eubacteriales bacterium]|nr:sugar transferase [Clostridiales bacterium]MDD7595226.1 sugar transferase [Clostridiales bacterium]MDY4886266.1 sugar transferase [Eubacteriales bacterium]